MADTVFVEALKTAINDREIASDTHDNTRCGQNGTQQTRKPGFA